MAVHSKTGGSHSWEVYVSYIFINTYAPSDEVEGQAAEEMHGNNIVLRHPVNPCPPLPGVVMDQGDQV